MTICRRDFIKNSLVVGAASMLPEFGHTEDLLGPTIRSQLPATWTNGIPPLYVTAYVDPTIPSQKNQEAIVAKYPLAITGQGSDIYSKMWRDKVRSINPAIKFLAYQQTNSETLVPGPGHDILRKINTQDVFTKLAGIVPTVFGGRRLYDFHNTIWQNAFLDACEVVYHSYPFDGLFLDNCTVFVAAAPTSAQRLDMLAALDATLTRLRQRLPNAIIIANGIDHFPALNGSMNEDRARDLPAEMTARNHKTPTFNLYQFSTNLQTPDANLIRTNLEIALHNKCFFGVAPPDDYQHIYWPPLFDQVMALYPTSPPKTMDPLQTKILRN